MLVATVSASAKSSSSHSGLANITDSWASDHTSLKRRKSQQGCSSPNQDVTSDYGFCSSEITLTLVPSDSNGYKRHRKDSERNIDSGVTLRYKDPETMAPTEKVLDDNVRQYFGSSKDFSIHQFVKKQSDEVSESTVLNECLEKISSEISIYSKQECEKSPQGVSTSCKSPSRSPKHNSQTVIKVSPEVELISSPKSSQRMNRKSSLETSKCDVLEKNAKHDTNISEMNNNPSPHSRKESFGLKLQKAVQYIESPKVKKTDQSIVSLKTSKTFPCLTSPKISVEETFTPIISRALARKVPQEENPVFVSPRSREKLDKWSEIIENDVNMQDVSSSISLPEQIYNFEDDYQHEKPHYIIGFENPAGENRCWLNASVHALFALPFTDSLDTMNLPECSSATNTLISIQTLWRQKADKMRIHQLMRKFKEDLSILDESYPSERQQDVSEFLMKFLNHLKLEFEKLMTGNAKIQEIENVPENPQDHRKSKAALESNKRRPLVDISSINGKLRRNSNLSEPCSSPNSQKVERLANDMEISKENSDSEESKNPIDEYFLCEMTEQVVCKGCSDMRHLKVDNMMLYVEVVSKQNDAEPVNLQKAIFRNFEKDERTVTCEKCKHEVQDVTTTFSKHPKILVVQVNRYGVTENGDMGKICKPVTIPEKLVISPSLMSNGSESDEIYKPICVISHVGEGMDCGHYTSYIEHENQWYHYNDLNVYSMTSMQVFEAAQTTAYLIFFVNSNLLDKSNADPSKAHFN